MTTIVPASISSGQNMTSSSRLVTAILFLALAARGQRLSQGASDWYMRFHSNFDFVKRNVERPVAKAFLVDSTVHHKYAVTNVQTVVYNPANVEQEYIFGFVMPEQALVSNVTIKRQRKSTRDEDANGHAKVNIVHANVNASDYTIKALNKAQGSSANNGGKLIVNGNGEKHVSFNQFVLTVNLGPHDETTITLVYEYLLERTRDKYQHIISISPGEILEDFQVRLAIKDDLTLTKVKVTVPVIGRVDASTIAAGQAIIGLNLSQVEQFHYFGSHGFTGDLCAEFDVPIEKDKADVVIEGDHFAHFYSGPSETMESIPANIMFLVDVSASMVGDKLTMAKKALENLLYSMNERNFFNIAVYNGKFGNAPQDWHPDTAMFDLINSNDQLLMEAFPCTKEYLQPAIAFIENLQVEAANTTSNFLAEAVVHAIELDEQIWATGAIPDNVVSRIVLLTDGGHPSTDEDETIKTTIRRSNLSSKLPILAIGIGFYANMDMLEQIAATNGGLAENIIEGVNVADQLEEVKKHLQDVILKDVQLRYLAENDIPLQKFTQSHFHFFRQGSSVVVAGKLPSAAGLATIEITAQSSKGQFMRRIDFVPNAQHLGCSADAVLCTEPAFEGQCVSLNESQSKLSGLEFANKAVSVKIQGDCAWMMCTRANFKGQKLTLMPGAYEVLPGSLYQNIASLKVVAQPSAQSASGMVATQSSTISRLWDYLTIKDSITTKGIDRDQLEAMLKVATNRNFLTPYTNIYLAEDAAKESLSKPDNIKLTYQDLSPIFYQLDNPDLARQWEALLECQKPIQCQDNFHIESYAEDEDDVDHKCNGSLVIYTRPYMDGDHLMISDSLNQIYHSTYGQRIGSVKSVGDCCWLLFDHRFFTGNVDKICGDAEQPHRKKNVGSVKRIAQQPPESP